MKKFFLILLIIFLCGILSADICIEQIKGSAVILGKDVYYSFANKRIGFSDLFWNILYERIKQLLIFMLFCLTPIREKLSVFLVGVFSFVWGFFSMCCVAEMGMAGVVISIASVIPHGLFYGGVLILLVQNKFLRTYRAKEKALKELGSYLFIALLFVTGCVLESIVGTHFIPWVIRLSQI